MGTSHFISLSIQFAPVVSGVLGATLICFGRKKNELKMISATRFGFQKVNFGLRDHRVLSLKTGVLNKQKLLWTKNG